MRNKRHTLSGLAALTLFDLVAAQAQAQTPVPFNWTGFYVGGHVGQRWGNVTTNFPMGDIPGFTGVRDSFGIGAPPFLNIPTKRHPDSGIIGVHAGYNLHFAPTWLVGLETSWDWGRGIDDFVRNFANNSTDSFGTLQLTTKLTWSGTVRGRFGYVQNDWLFYGTGGVAFQRINVSALGNMTQFFAGDSISVLTRSRGQIY
jgi:outer membrane immunogenic protein